MKIRIHVNKAEMKKGKDARPWTIHTSKACIPARQVLINVPAVTEYKPHKKSNPRAFLVCYGRICLVGNSRYQIEP